MAHLALYRSYRPQTFAQVVGQEQVVIPLKQSILLGEIGHAYLFSGTRGTGKTSIAKIFSRAINCLNPQDGSPCNECEVCKSLLDGSLLDVIEFDAASNTGVDYMRRIVDEVLYQPIRAKYKVYIIDEAHMLSAGAFNALLKTLEEPPEHVVFVFATTEMTKIPATIISRCQRYHFPRIPNSLIQNHLRQIATDMQISVEDEALATLATLSEGAMRDAISLLDQAQYNNQTIITREGVLDLAGLGGDLDLARLALAVCNGDSASVVLNVDKIYQNGVEAAQIILGVLKMLRHALVLQIAPSQLNNLTLSDEVLKIVSEIKTNATAETLERSIMVLSKQLPELRHVRDARTVVEIVLLGMARRSVDTKTPLTAPKTTLDTPVARATVTAKTTEVEAVADVIAPKIAEVAAKTSQQPSPVLQDAPSNWASDIVPPPEEAEPASNLEQPPTTEAPRAQTVLAMDVAPPAKVETPSSVAPSAKPQRSNQAIKESLLNHIYTGSESLYQAVLEAKMKYRGDVLTLAFEPKSKTAYDLSNLPKMRDIIVKAAKAVLGQNTMLLIEELEVKPKEAPKPDVTEKIKRINSSLGVPTIERKQ